MARKINLQVEAILYAIEKYPDIGRTKLMKFIFFSDLVWYNMKHDTMLENEYIRMPRGPVPSYAFALTESSNEYFDVLKDTVDPEITFYRFIPKRKAFKKEFDEQMIQVMSSILELLRKSTVRSISDFCHEFKLWRHSRNGYAIPKELFKLDEIELLEVQSLIAFSRAKELSMIASEEFDRQGKLAQGQMVAEEIIAKQIDVLDSDDV